MLVGVLNTFLEEAYLARLGSLLPLPLIAIVECVIRVLARQSCNRALRLPEPKALAARLLGASWRRMRKYNE